MTELVCIKFLLTWRLDSSFNTSTYYSHVPRVHIFYGNLYSAITIGTGRRSVTTSIYMDNSYPIP